MLFRSSNKWGEIAEQNRTDSINSLLKTLPIVDKYQSWLLENQYLYIDYQVDIYRIWNQILDKLVYIISDTENYAQQNLQDLFELQYQLLDIIEFIANIVGESTNPEFGINKFKVIMVEKNIEMNKEIVKWIQQHFKNIPITTRFSYDLTNYLIDDYVAPCNLRKFENKLHD